METAWQFLKNITTGFPYDPEIALLDICLKNSKTLISKDICTPMLIAALLTVAKTWGQPNVL